MTIKTRNFLLIFGAAFFLVSGIGAEEDENKSNLATEIFVCLNIEDREPVGTGQKFKLSDNEIYAWTKIKGATQPTEVFHVWKYKKEVVSRVKLKIHSSSYRTWSRKLIEGMPGKWSVEVVDSLDRSIAEESFVVKKR